MHDLLVKNARIADGLGSPLVEGDLAVKDGRVAAVGRIREEAAQTVDAKGMVLAPGCVDLHTHYDAQLTWDPVPGVLGYKVQRSRYADYSVPTVFQCPDPQFTDGFISKAEAAGPPHAADFASLDKNGDGKLSSEEHYNAKEHVAARSKAGTTGSTASSSTSGSMSSSGTNKPASGKTY